MQYADIALAALGVLALAWLADALGGRRGLGGALLVAGVGAGCGAFLSIRVFAVATLEQWPWILWALGGAAITLTIYTLLRSKR